MIEVIRAGQFSTIQDLGRFGHRAIGVPVAGPMDRYSARLANELLGNAANAAVLEMSFTGATLLFHESTSISITGANCFANDGKRDLPMNEVVEIAANTEIKFGATSAGNFAYLAVRGGLKSGLILGSVSYSKGITQFVRIEKGQIIRFNKSENRNATKGVKFKISEIETNGFIQVEKGPEFHLLSERAKQQLIDSVYSISKFSNRMGFVLNEKLDFDAKEIITSPVQPGTVQLTPSGQLIVLMRDAQTTGGYSRVLQLTPSSINRLAQKPFDEEFKFQLID